MRKKDSDEQEEEEMIQEKEEEEEEEKPDETESKEGSNQQDPLTPLRTPNRWVQKNHPPKQIIGDNSTGMETKRRKHTPTPEHVHLSLISIVEPSSFEEAKMDKDWIKEMEEELSQIEKNDTWEPVPRPKDKNVIGTKWVFRKKLDENGQLTRNKARLVCKGYAQIEGVDFE